jgi:hypothetical protein
MVICDFIGIYKMGSLQIVYRPIIVPNAYFSGASDIISNSSDVHTELVIVHTDASNIGLIPLIIVRSSLPPLK